MKNNLDIDKLDRLSLEVNNICQIINYLGGNLSIMLDSDSETCYFLAQLPMIKP